MKKILMFLRDWIVSLIVVMALSQFAIVMFDISLALNIHVLIVCTISCFLAWLIGLPGAE